MAILKAVDLDAAHKEAWGALLMVHAALTRKFDRALEMSGCLSLQVYDVLLALETVEGRRMRMSDLAEAVIFDPSSLTRLVDRLERLGYVERQQHGPDRRCVYAAITPKGLEAREQSWATYRELIQRHFARYVSGQEAGELSQILFRILEQEGAPIAARRAGTFPVDPVKAGPSSEEPPARLS